METFIGLMLPFLGTTLGSACVFFMKDKINDTIQKMLLGFASGIMVAASVWSLIIPAIDMSEDMGKLSFIPALVGFMIGITFLFGMDHLIPHLHLGSSDPEGPQTKLKKSTMLVLAVTLHNVPEGMAVGVAFAGMLAGVDSVTFAAAIALSIGIAIQNFPEGAIISMPLKAEGLSRKKAFVQGTLSGIVEPIAAIITILIASIMIPILPYLLCFAAGAMIYVVVEELLPEASQGEHSNIATWGFAIGFCVMMVLDVSLG